MSITTKTGDSGQTGLFGGKRVSKGCNDIEAIGDVDELNSMIGVVRSTIETRRGSSAQQEEKRKKSFDSAQDKKEERLDINQILEYIQNCCFVIGAQIASLEMKKKEMIKMIKIEERDVARLEGYIERFEKQLPELHNFILPSGHAVASQLFLTRAVCRRAERGIVRLDKIELSEVLKFINRLSDLLFLLARFVNQLENKKETIWSR